MSGLVFLYYASLIVGLASAGYMTFAQFPRQFWRLHAINAWAWIWIAFLLLIRVAVMVIIHRGDVTDRGITDAYFAILSMGVVDLLLVLRLIDFVRTRHILKNRLRHKRNLGMDENPDVTFRDTPHPGEGRREK